MKIHNNATTTPFLRNLIQKKDDIKNVAGFCRMYGISRKTFYVWKIRTSTGDISSNRKKIMYKLTKEDEHFILKIRKETNASAKYINEILRSRSINVSLSTLYRLFSKYGINKKERKFEKFDSLAMLKNALNNY